MSVGGPCPHEAVQAEGHDHNDGEDHEFHGRSLLPRGVADELRPRPQGLSGTVYLKSETCNLFLEKMVECQHE